MLAMHGDASLVGDGYQSFVQLRIWEALFLDPTNPPASQAMIIYKMKVG